MLTHRADRLLPAGKPSYRRLVCHECGFKFPLGAVGAGCCRAPRLHVHDARFPCEHCADHQNEVVPHYRIAQTPAAPMTLMFYATTQIFAPRRWTRLLNIDTMKGRDS